MSENSGWEEILRSCESPPEPTGEITAGQFERWLDDLNAPLGPLMDAIAADYGQSLPPASPERVSEITAGMIHRELDRMMTAPDPCYFAMLELDPERIARELGSMVDALFCRAVLFPLPPRPPLPVEPVHPLLAVYWDPRQGPQPATCLRVPHPESPWHWADGTWWR